MVLSWVFGVLSTDYDLHDYREAIINKLKNKNVCISAFELPDFPVEPDKHSHENCITALKRTNVCILVIDKRFGGIFYDSSENSITMEEYLTAIDDDIPCLVFVNRKAWDERHAYDVDLKSSKKKQVEFDKKYKCKYVESVDTIHFIDNIHKAYDTRKCSNWITFFDGIPDLLENIEGKLKGLSRFWIKQIVNKQRLKLTSRKTSTSLSMSLGDVFDKGYYMEPEYCVESGFFSDSKKVLGSAIVNDLLNSKSVLVYGEAGYGKTTILAKCFLNHVDHFNKDDGYKIPFYIWLKDKKSSYHFDFVQYLNECFEKYLNIEAYPYLDVSNVSPFFYLDGFDEIAEKISVEEMDSMCKSTIFASPMMLTSRIQFALRYLKNFDFSNKFDVRVKINKWDIGKAKDYINNFCRINGKDQDFVKKIYVLLTDNKELCDILDNPLLITMLLWVIEKNRMNIPETISTRAELFKAYLMEMARREIDRIRIVELGEEDLVIIWSYFAWLVYREKLKKRQAKMNQAIQELQDSLLPEYGKEYNEGLFDALFDSSSEYVFGTFHEQFLEFLVANTFLHASLNEREPYPEFLRYVVRPEINRYFRAIWNESTIEEREKIANNIYSQYLYNSGTDDAMAVATRVHAIYHVSRLDSTSREENLKRAFTLETNISVRLSLFFGIIKMGKLDKEDEFFNLLNTDMDYSIANRGYHLAYYSDMSSDGNMPFEDNCDIEWTNTLQAFLKHFKSSKKEQYFMRRIDLITLYQLMESRNSVQPMTKEILDDLENMTYNPPIKNQKEFQRAVEETFKKVKDKYVELCNK